MSSENAGTASVSSSEEHSLDQYLDHGMPIWDAIDFDVLCSRCNYNLRMLPQPRCPECGLEFDWHIVLNRSAWRSDYLFEHHWSARPFSSWLKTTRRSFRPTRFWKNVSIHDRIHPGPLWFLLITSLLWWSIIFHGLAWVAGLAIEAMLSAGLWPQATSGANQWSNLSSTLQAVGKSMFEGGSLTLWSMLSLAILGALGLICMLRQTLGRCRVRTVQILRVVAYSSTPFFMIWAIAFLTCLVISLCISHTNDNEWLIWLLQILVLAVFVVLQGIYTGAGLKHYLRLPRSYLIGITAAFVGGLFGFTVVFFCTITAQMGW